jgi:hypothetical protein
MYAVATSAGVEVTEEVVPNTSVNLRTCNKETKELNIVPFYCISG